MMTTVDGKILGERWGDSKQVEKLRGKFEEVHEMIGVKAWVVGRTTMEKDFTMGEKPIHKTSHEKIDRLDFVGNRNAGSFAIAVDAQAKLGWKKPLMHGDHVITILTEGVADSYLAHLRDIGVSYIFAGKDTLDLTTAVEKLRDLFGIEKLMLEGGGVVNGSFLNDNLVDEFQHVVLPLIDGTRDTSTAFDVEENVKKFNSRLLKLEDVKKMDNDVLWIKYKVAR